MPLYKNKYLPSALSAGPDNTSAVIWNQNVCQVWFQDIYMTWQVQFHWFHISKGLLCFAPNSEYENEMHYLCLITISPQFPLIGDQ